MDLNLPISVFLPSGTFWTSQGTLLQALFCMQHAGRRVEIYSTQHGKAESGTWEAMAEFLYW